MRVLKVTAEGIMTSFRYPHFMQGIHPTFEMPPPATIYGHICSALGEWISPAGLRFAYRFTYEGKVDDVEHIHVLTPATGKIPRFDLPKTSNGSVNPFKRTLLFKPRLSLYLDRPEWQSAFRSPHYALILGRSQDLFTYTNVEVIRLVRSDSAYFEHTLAPYSLSRQTARGIAILMPRFLDYSRNRAPTFGRYVVITKRVHSRELLREPSETYWVDPTTPLSNDSHLGLFFHQFIGEHDDAMSLA